MRYRHADSELTRSARDIELPTDPHDVESAIEYEAVAEILVGLRSRAETEGSDQWFAATIGRFDQREPVRIRCIFMTNDADVRGKLDARGLVDGRMTDVGDHLIARVGGIDLEVSDADDPFEIRCAEIFARQNLPANKLRQRTGRVRKRSEQSDDNRRKRAPEHGAMLVSAVCSVEWINAPGVAQRIPWISTPDHGEKGVVPSPIVLELETRGSYGREVSRKRYAPSIAV